MVSCSDISLGGMVCSLIPKGAKLVGFPPLKEKVHIQQVLGAGSGSEGTCRLNLDMWQRSLELTRSLAWSSHKRDRLGNY